MASKRGLNELLNNTSTVLFPFLKRILNQESDQYLIFSTLKAKLKNDFHRFIASTGA
jgi:hypothetical protein